MAEYAFSPTITVQGSGGPNDWQPGETVPFTILFSAPPAPNDPFDPSPDPPFTPPIIPSLIIVADTNGANLLTYEYTIHGVNGDLVFPATQQIGIHVVYGDPDPITISFDSTCSIEGSMRNDSGGVIGQDDIFFSFIFDAPDPSVSTAPVPWPGTPRKINLPPPSFKCKC